MQRAPYLACVVLLGLIGFRGPPASADEPATAQAAVPAEAAEGSAPLDFEAVIETAKRKVYPALVFVKPVQEDLSAGESRRVEVLGSGVIFRADGYVVTNHHVAEKAREIRCVLGDRRQVEADVVGLDKVTDLAVLRLKLEPDEVVPYAEFGRVDDLEEGQFVLALGSPYGFERSLSLGIVSNASRYLDEAAHPYNNWIQTDAAINPGNSGGPLVNTRGQVIGINTLALRQANDLGFAVPVDIVRRVVDRILDGGRVQRSRHGLTLRALVDYLQNTVFDGEDGVIVDDVAPGSPAADAGFHKGDRVLTIDGTSVRGKYKEDLPAIRWQLADLEPGQPYAVTIQRGDATHSLSLVPGEDESSLGDGLECDRWDATFQRITEDETPELHFWQPRGVYVLGVSFPGNAASSGLRSKDIVVRADHQAVATLDDLQAVYERVLAEDREKKRVLLQILRDGLPRYVALDYGPDYDQEK